MKIFALSSEFMRSKTFPVPLFFCGGALNKKKNILCGYFDDELLIAW